MRIIVVGLIAGLVAGAGCGGSRPEPALDYTAQPELKFPERPPYTLAVGDELSILFFYYRDYNLNVAVRPDGMITVPLMGDVKAEGVRPSELEKVIRAGYAEVLAEPEVSVIVNTFADRRFFVFGEVRNPGVFSLTGSMTLLDALVQAGGIEDTGRKDSIILIRKSGDGTFKGFKVDVDAMLAGRSGESIPLMPTDVIYVPMTTIAKVDVFVDQFFQKISPVWHFYLSGRQVVNPREQYILGD